MAFFFDYTDKNELWTAHYSCEHSHNFTLDTFLFYQQSILLEMLYNCLQAGGICWKLQERTSQKID
jgi:hypothetical protein